MAINSNRAPRMRSICPLSVCSSGEYVYVTAEPISLPPSPLFRPSSPVIFPSVPRRPPSYPPPIGYCSFSSLCIPATSPLRQCPIVSLSFLPSSLRSCNLRDSVGLIPTGDERAGWSSQRLLSRFPRVSPTFCQFTSKLPVTSTVST